MAAVVGPWAEPHHRHCASTRFASALSSSIDTQGVWSRGPGCRPHQPGRPELSPNHGGVREQQRPQDERKNN